MSKKGRDVDRFNLKLLAEKSKGFSGAEIEEVINEALFQAYDKEREINDGDIQNAIKKTFPLSKTIYETIDKIRKWAKTHAVSSPREEPEQLEIDNKNIPKLKQETYNNPFID